MKDYKMEDLIRKIIATVRMNSNDDECLSQIKKLIIDDYFSRKDDAQRKTEEK